MKISKLILMFVLGGSLVACQKGPTDEQLKDVLSKAHDTLMVRDSSSFQQKDQKVKALLQDADKLFDIGKADARQFGLLAEKRILVASSAVRRWVTPRLSSLSKRNDKEGAMAAYYLLAYDSTRNKSYYSGDVAAEFLKHPAVGELFCDSLIGTALMTKFLPSVTGDQSKKAELVKLLTPYVNDNLPENQVFASIYLFDQALELDTLVSAEDREALRTSVLKQQERILTTFNSPNDAAKVKGVGKNIAYLNTPIALGTLIGGEAPEIEFLWTSDGKAQKLSDLKGKVVVLDFWATWCGPCIGSFPNIRELQKRYKGFPVEIVGVTSLQGKHIQRKGGEREVIKTEGDPQKELDLMKGFMKDLDMTWKVAFSKDNVFDMRYGVKGIPHVAIVDAQGRVRYNALRPYEAPFHEAEKIDALLKEAGLKCPAEPMTQENYVK